ncbi:hypothetical protein C4566_02360, partial [Candidatus Parcubacteria bacterium]
DAGVRKWLTYFILLVSVVVMIGFLIATINSFLDGDLTTKFILKTLTALIISGSVFSFYLYDIKRESVEGKKDKVINFFAWGSLLVIAIVFVASWFFVQSPQETRKVKIDQEIIEDFYQINSAVIDYYTINDKMPSDLDVLLNNPDGFKLSVEVVQHSSSGKYYDYQVTADDEYKICADFVTSNIGDNAERYYYYGSGDYNHDSGYQCFSQKVSSMNEGKVPAAPIRIE